MAEKPKIIIVDDIEENLRAAKGFFDSLKFPVDYGMNLEEGKDFLNKYGQNYFLGIFDLDMPKEKDGEIIKRAGLELGELADEKDIFYVYFSGGFFHGGPKTRVYLNKEQVLNEKPYEQVTSKSQTEGWKELYNKLIEFSKEPSSELEDSLNRYKRFLGKEFDWRQIPKEVRVGIINSFY